jgi:UDP-glucose 4-epimerase
MARVLVTGGAGTIGSAVVRRLLSDADWEVRIADHREPPAWMREGCELHVGDLRELDVAARALQGCTHVIHLAAIVGGIANFHQLPFTLTEVNNALTGAIVHAAVDQRVQRFTYVSSSMVFERATEFPTSETQLDGCLAPRSPARSTRAPPTTSTACPTRSAGRSTPTVPASCLTATSPGSPTRCRT